MRSITGQLTPELKNHIADGNVGTAPGYPIQSYGDLVEHVARLSYLNTDFLLFFRGQGRDFRNKAGSSQIYPSIYRGERVSRLQKAVLGKLPIMLLKQIGDLAYKHIG